MSTEGPNNDLVHNSRPSPLMLVILAVVGVGFVLLASYSKEIEALIVASPKG